ncbi:MAG: CpsD/CapB family tyrosine-protein kinase [Anaerolineae bacterium]
MTDTPDLVTLTDPQSPAAEAYRTLRMNLQFAALDSDLRTLLVTSPGPGEGKTTTLANLAVTMAQIDQRIIVADCDLRKPYLHRLFDVSNELGLTTMLLEDDALANPPLQETAVTGLSVLPSGPLPPRPADLLGSKRMLKVIDELCKEADVVLFDAPPVMAVTDAAVLATRLDGVLLVVSAGETKREHASDALERLRKINANIVGAVLNNAAIEPSLAGYYR